MVILDMASRTINVGTVGGSSWSIHSRRCAREEQKGLIERLLLERISLAGIARVLQLSEDCVQRYVNRFAHRVSRQVEVTQKPKKRLTVQMDELWSFVDWHW